MPILLPPKAKALRRNPQGSVDVFADWVGIWSISLGVAAAAFAMFVYFGARDQTAATFILTAAALLVFLASYASGMQRDS